MIIRLETSRTFVASSITHPLHEVDDLLLGGVAGQELVDVRHQVDANGACKGIAILHIAQ